MWNKPQQEQDTPSPQPEMPTTPQSTPPPPAERQAVLGPSITIKGSLSGEEDLLIEGHVEGEVSFKRHAVTIGKRGRVDADLYCKSIIVEGEVHGNLFGDDLVVVRKSAHVKGNAVAPRVTLEDGAQFHGSIDMQPKQSTPPQADKPTAAPLAVKQDPEAGKQKSPSHAVLPQK